MADLDSRLEKLSALAEPLRRTLYAFVVRARAPVTREQAAEGVDVPLHVAKFHLDRLVDDGLLEADYRRPPGRGGPGAGRPAKVYRRADVEVEVSLPERRYDVARLRGAGFTFDVSAVAWAAAAVVGIAVAMHSVAEILAAKIEKQEEYVGVAPPVALVPWFFAGSFFPISAMPAGLTAFAKMLPLTHALAVLRYALVDHAGHGLHDIWGMDNTTVMAALSLGVVAVFAAGMLALAMRVFSRSAIV